MRLIRLSGRLSHEGLQSLYDCYVDLAQLRGDAGWILDNFQDFEGHFGDVDFYQKMIDFKFKHWSEGCPFYESVISSKRSRSEPIMNAFDNISYFLGNLLGRNKTYPKMLGNRMTNASHYLSDYLHSPDRRKGELVERAFTVVIEEIDKVMHHIKRVTPLVEEDPLDFEGLDL